MARAELLNTRRISEKLGCSQEYVRRLHREGKLPTKKRTGTGICCWDYELEIEAGRGKNFSKKSVNLLGKVLDAGLRERRSAMMIQPKKGVYGNIFHRTYRYKSKKSGKVKTIENWHAYFFINGDRKDFTLKAKTRTAAKREASELQFNLQSELMNGRLSTNEQEVLFQDFAYEYLESYAKERKRSWESDQKYLNTHLIPFFQNKYLSEITPRDIKQYIDHRKKEGVKNNGERIRDLKNKTINLELALLRRMLNLAIKWDYGVVKNPIDSEDFLDDSDSIRNRVLTIEDERRLIKEAAPHLRSIIQCALFQAMRLQEILKLKINDVDFNKEEITIQKKVSKNKKTQIIPIMPGFRPILEKLIKENGGRTEFVFNYEDPKTAEFRPITSIQHSFTAACRRAGIKGLQFRDLRRTCATRLHESGVDPLVASRFLRHSSVKLSSEVYIQSSQRFMRQELERMEPVTQAIN
jgi:integrase